MIRGLIIAHFQAVPFRGPVSDVLHRTSEKHPECSKFCSFSRNSWSKYYNTHVCVYIYIDVATSVFAAKAIKWIYIYIHISYIHENIMKTKYCKLIEQEIHWNTSVPWAPWYAETRIRHHHNEVNQKPRHHVADLSDHFSQEFHAPWIGAMNGCQLMWSSMIY